MIDLNAQLDLTDAEAQTFLSQIQGNILKGHGRDHAAHLILRMKGRPAEVRQAIAKFTSASVTSAQAQMSSTKNWKQSGGTGDSFIMFLLSADGYRYLGFPDGDLPVPVNDPFGPSYAGEYFKRGMKKQASLARSFNDPPSSQWETAYQGEVHAMIIVADDSKDYLDKIVVEISTSLKDIFEVLCVEQGERLAFAFPKGTLTIEHFGFQDGVSQPLMIKQEVAQRGNTNWDPGAPLSLALAPEAGGTGMYGSFMVFRKLEQNVRDFWQAVGNLSKQEGMDLEMAGAMAVGRFRDGTPLIPTGTTALLADANDFHYDQDPIGGKCPFHAHIRKTNPRGDVPRFIGAPAAFERSRRIIRRGITYGDRPDLRSGNAAERPSSGVGLLFMCFQSNLDQFAIQQEGADSNDFIQGNTGVDAVIGQNSTPVAQTWPSTGTAKFTMANFVKLLGGEYFFAPSISFLKSLNSPS